MILLHFFVLVWAFPFLCGSVSAYLTHLQKDRPHLHPKPVWEIVLWSAGLGTLIGVLMLGSISLLTSQVIKIEPSVEQQCEPSSPY